MAPLYAGGRRAVAVIVGSLIIGLVMQLCGPQPVRGAGATFSRIAVSGLRADNATDPLGVDNRRPALSWRLASTVNGARQTAYRLLVASSPRRLSPAAADVWDSGKIIGGDSVDVRYAGPDLRSSSRYFWTVQIWDAQGRPSRWSRPAYWEMGLLDAAAWEDAKWISPRAGDESSWSDFTLDGDFTITSAAASFVFRAKDASNYYLWQINSVTTPGRVMLRPHVQVAGGFVNLGEVDLAPVVTPANVASPHHFKLRAEGSTFTTWIDGVQVDTRTNAALTRGTIGFRSSISNNVAERARYDNIVLRTLSGVTLFSDDFSTSPDPWFPRTAINAGQLEPTGDPTLLDGDPGAPMLRRTFTLDKAVASARAYVYGLGFYELHLNGTKVGDHVLSPAASQYEQRNLYDTYDVTNAVKQGDNAVGIWLGNGYGARFNPYGFRWLGAKQAIMMLKVTYADGTQQSVKTDDGWTWSNGAITANDIYAGEDFDARLDQVNWDRAGFDAAHWMPAQTVPAPGGELVANAMPPIRVVQDLRPVKLSQPRPGIFVYDLGQNIAGWARLHVQGPAGTTIRMRTAEELDNAGMLDTVTNRNAASADTYVLAGTGGPETYEPRFTYHGFRYVEVTGYPGTPTLDSLDGRVVHADVVSTGQFESSNALLDKIWQNNRWGMLNNSFSTPTDTPVRDERTPPAMDVQAYADASTREFAMADFYAKYLMDLPPGVALPNDAGNAQNPDMAGGQISLAWTLYEQYGDRATLAAHFAEMKRFVDTNVTNHPDHIWPADHGFGDWCPPDQTAGANGGMGGPGAGTNTSSEVSIVNTALSYKQAADVAKAAAALGYPADAAHYAQVAADIKNAFNARFGNAAGNGYGSGRQTTSVLPLAFGMVPDDMVQAVGAQLVDTILHKNGGHLDTGIFGTRYLVDALAAINRIDIAMTVLNQTSYPGFGFQIGKGATTSWEQWLYSAGMQTHDHAMFAGINSSLYTQLAGITPASPGYRAIAIRPQVPDTLDHVAATLDTVRGTVGSAWTRSESAFRLTVTIPVNATATVHVPLFGHGADRVAIPDGAALLKTGGGDAVFSVGSGRWTFSTRLGA